MVKAATVFSSGGALEDDSAQRVHAANDFRQAVEHAADFFEPFVERCGAFEIRGFTGGLRALAQFEAIRDAPCESSVSTTRATSEPYSSFVQPAKHGARHIFISE